MRQGVPQFRPSASRSTCWAVRAPKPVPARQSITESSLLMGCEGSEQRPLRQTPLSRPSELGQSASPSQITGRQSEMAGSVPGAPGPHTPTNRPVARRFTTWVPLACFASPALDAPGPAIGDTEQIRSDEHCKRKRRPSLSLRVCSARPRHPTTNHARSNQWGQRDTLLRFARSGMAPSLFQVIVRREW
jgi:hypothetical protein